MKTVANKIAAEELFIYTINNSTVYHCSIKPLIANYRKKIAKNQYNKEKAIKGFENIAKIAAMHYEKEFLNNKYYIVFNAATRRVAAERILEFLKMKLWRWNKMKMYGVEVTIENGKVTNASYEGIKFYPMKWNTKEHRWEYCIGRYTREYFRKLLNKGVVRFDYLSVKNGRR